MRRRIGLTIIAVLLAVAIPAMAADDAQAAAGDPCTVYFFHNGEQTEVAGICGEPLDPDSIADLIAMGTWHQADGTAWDPAAPIPETLPHGTFSLALDAPPAEPEKMDPVVIAVPIIAAIIVGAVLVLGYFVMRRH